MYEVRLNRLPLAQMENQSETRYPIFKATPNHFTILKVIQELIFELKGYKRKKQTTLALSMSQKKFRSQRLFVFYNANIKSLGAGQT